MPVDRAARPARLRVRVEKQALREGAGTADAARKGRTEAAEMNGGFSSPSGWGAAKRDAAKTTTEGRQDGAISLVGASADVGGVV